MSGRESDTSYTTLNEQQQSHTHVGSYSISSSESSSSSSSESSIIKQSSSEHTFFLGAWRGVGGSGLAAHLLFYISRIAIATGGRRKDIYHTGDLCVLPHGNGVCVFAVPIVFYQILSFPMFESCSVEFRVFDTHIGVSIRYTLRLIHYTFQTN